MAQAPKGFTKSLELVHDDLFPVWNADLERFQIMFSDKRTKITRIICTVEEDNGDYRPLDMRTVFWLGENVAWDLLDTYPNAADWVDKLRLKKEMRLANEKETERDFKRWWNKEHRKEWVVAIENARKGIFASPEPEREKKIIIT